MRKEWSLHNTMEKTIITKKDLGWYSRLDPDFYKTEYNDMVDYMRSKKNVKPLGEIISKKICTGWTPPEQKGIPVGDGTDVLFIRTNSVREGKINYDIADLLPVAAHKNHTALKYGDVVVTVVGATRNIVGRAGVYLLDRQANINRGCALLRINTEIATPGFISAFLNSKYGRMQIWKYGKQTEQVVINGREVEQVLVPILPMEQQNVIHDIILNSEKLRVESKLLYRKAEQTLLHEINMNGFKHKPCKHFTINSKSINEENGTKIEPEYFEPSVDNIIKHIKEHVQSDTANHVFLWDKGKDVGSDSYVDEGMGFARVSDISKFGLDPPVKRIKKPLFDSLKKHHTQKNKILFTKDGTVGISYVIKDENPCVLSGAFMSLSLKEKYSKTNPEYLALVLNSLMIKAQIDRLTGKASILKHLNPKYFSKLVIPIISSESQTKIASMLNQSFQKKREADISLQQSINSISRMLDSS